MGIIVKKKIQQLEANTGLSVSEREIFISPTVARTGEPALFGSNFLIVPKNSYPNGDDVDSNTYLKPGFVFNNSVGDADVEHQSRASIVDYTMEVTGENLSNSPYNGSSYMIGGHFAGTDGDYTDPMNGFNSVVVSDHYGLAGSTEYSPDISSIDAGRVGLWNFTHFTETEQNLRGGAILVDDFEPSDNGQPVNARDYFGASVAMQGYHMFFGCPGGSISPTSQLNRTGTPTGNEAYWPDYSTNLKSVHDIGFFTRPGYVEHRMRPDAPPLGAPNGSYVWSETTSYIITGTADTALRYEGAQFGASMDYCDGILAIGAPGAGTDGTWNTAGKGAVGLYKLTPSGLTFISLLTSINSDLYTNLSSSTDLVAERFGWGVLVGHGRVAVSSIYHGNGLGAVYLYNYAGDLVRIIMPPGEIGADWINDDIDDNYSFGWSMHWGPGNTIIIGQNASNISDRQGGRVFIYDRDNGEFVKEIFTPGASNRFGPKMVIYDGQFIRIGDGSMQRSWIFDSKFNFIGKHAPGNFFFSGANGRAAEGYTFEGYATTVLTNTNSDVITPWRLRSYAKISDSSDFEIYY